MGNGSSAALGVDPPAAKSTVSFQLNGEAVLLRDVSPLLSLNDWLRSQSDLAGTKRMCDEGGCGCCVVAVVTGSSQLQGIGKTDDSWECVLPEKSSTIAINSVRNEVFCWCKINLCPGVVSMSTLCGGGMEHYYSGGTGEVS